MRLTYEELIAPPDVPITLSIGHIKQPTLREIWKHGVNLFRLYQVYMRLTPNDYFTQLNREACEKYWNTLSDEQQKGMTMFDIVLLDDDVAIFYQEILNFFFMERVVRRDNVFVLVDTNDYISADKDLEIDTSNYVGFIHSKNFDDVMDILQQVCCIKSDNPMDEKMPKFKNEKAKRLYEKMLKAKKKQEEKINEKERVNLSLPNIISATAAKCPGLNIVNIWDTTLFSLYDQFNKTQDFEMYYINAIRVSVWGDEKNQFDSSLWYKNHYDKTK